MENIYERNVINHKPWKKFLCVLLSFIIAFGAVITLTAGSSRLQDWLGIQSMLSAYAKDFVDTKGAVSLNQDEMLSDNKIIDFENEDGSNTIYLFSEPITFVDDNGNIKAKDISVEKQSDKKLKSQGYSYANGQNDYRINFADYSSDGVLIEMNDISYSIIPQSDFSVAGKENISQILEEFFEDFEYKNIYGAGTNLKFYPQLNGVKDEIILDFNVNRNQFSFKLVTDNCMAVLNDDGTVSLIDSDNNTLQTFSAPYAFDSEYIEGYKNEHYTECIYTLETIDDNTYILTVHVSEEWLNSNTTVYPVTIDPTTSNVTNSADAGVCSAHRYTNYGNASTGGFGKSKENGYGRVYEKFEIPSAIKPGAKIEYANHWVRETTNKKESTYVRPFMVKGEWKETGINWSNKPGYDDTVNTNWKNINSASKDKENSPNWYNYNLVNCVKKWVNGTANNGVVFVSGEEVDADQEYLWRSFASRTHETSAMRPYTVINYTNDTTAPTVTISTTPSGFTKDSVTITLSNAKDTGGAGLHSKAFSFSTVKGSYNWGTEQSKKYSENCTVYVSVRDKADNIKTYTQKISNIDKDGPVISSTVLSTQDWTNDKVDISVFAADSASGVKDYSFSTISGSYNWNINNIKSFSENTTVYVAARDNLDNVSEEIKISIDNIDKTKPSIPSVTGDNNYWISGNTVLTAYSRDDGSGVSEYSFSASPNEYNWQSSNTFVPSAEYITLYVCAKDKAGNVSEQKKLEYKFDASLPAGTVTVEEPTSWVKNVIITANANDEVSGLHNKPYSFSSSVDNYLWQESNNYTAAKNGTYYIYVRDGAGNITLLDTVVIDKIDSTAPVVKTPDVKDEENKTIITITAEDSDSGIAAYSIDNGKTWQRSNVFEIEKDSLNFIAAKVKDNVGNVNATAKYHDFSLPEYFIQNGYIYLYNPKTECNDDIYYRFSNSLTQSWIKYDKPIKLDGQKTIYLSFYKTVSIASLAKYKFTLDYEPENVAEKFTYSEQATDLTLSYKTLNFDISRSFDNGTWSYSYNSYAEFLNDNIIHLFLPDYSDAYFVQENKYNFSDPLSGYKLSLIYDENDENIVACSIKIGNQSYLYSYENSKFLLSGVSDCYGSSFDIIRHSNIVEIIDNSGRSCIITNNENVTTITDFAGGVITYHYSDGRLASVTDQTGVVIDAYSYADDKIVKSSMMSVVYDSSGRVTQYLYDNGAYTTFEYGENSVTTKNSKDETSAYTYDDKDRVLSSTDNYGDETLYVYNDDDRTVQITKDGEVIKTYKYNADGTLNWEKPKDSDSNVYYYDSQKRVITEITADSYIHYVYDEYSNIVMAAAVKEEYTADRRYNYLKIQDDLDWYDITSYTYEDGLLVKSYDEKNDITVLYTYDDYGNTATQTTLTVEDVTTKIGKTESRYDILGRLVWSKSNDSETEYTYDAAGRLLLTKTDDNYYQRTVYDKNGRLVQEMDNNQYDPSLDNLPNAYGDPTAGQTYEYNQYGDLIKETNSFGIATEYEYSDIGNVYRKHFDIYDYYYTANGKCSSVSVNGSTIVDYAYNVDDASVTDETAKFVNLVTYADGYTEKQVTDKYGNTYYKYANDRQFYSISVLTKKKTLAYNNLESKRHNTINVSDSYYSYDSRNVYMQEIFNYNVKTTEDSTTVNETHFGTPFSAVIRENTVKYTAQAYQLTEQKANETLNDKAVEKTILVPVLGERNFTYSAENKEDKVTENITGDLGKSLVTEQYFDEESNTYHKNYNNELSFYNTYDDDGNIIADEKNSYTYNELGELISTSGIVNASYQYDSRGNITSKSVNGETTTYSYNNEWLDQLTSVNGIPLTYDANGNLASYGDTTYTWSHGKQLASVTNENGTYSYTYDENGIRLTKPGYTFDTLNGRILAQYNDKDKIYFQYNGDTPIGFILNQNQYYYITNPSGDIVGITDSKCDIIATYTYDEWGKLLSIETAEENNAVQLEIAEINPFRYRGYYYDNETGYYYLQSRYYDPNLGRFISADDFGYVDTSHRLNANAYSYCWNCPIALEDAEGTTPQISIDLSALHPLIADATAAVNKGISKLADNIKKLISKYNEFIDKLEYNINHPDVVINNSLSKLLDRDVSLKFPLINALRMYLGTLDIRKGELVGGEYSADDENSKNKMRRIEYGSAEHVVSVLIAEIINFFYMEDIAEALEIDFSFSNLAEFLDLKVELFTKAFNEGIISLDVAAKGFASDLSAWVSSFGGALGDYVSDNVSKAFMALPYFTNLINDYSGRYLSPIGSLMMVLFDTFMGFIIDGAGIFLEFAVNPVIGILFTASSDWLYDLESLRYKAEYLAYNWYYLFFI